MKRWFDLPRVNFEQEIENLMKSPNGDKCGLCGCEIKYGDEINYPDSPECCKTHGFIPLCPVHQEWFSLCQEVIGKSCIRQFYKEIIEQ